MDFWTDLPSWLRLVIALIVLGLGVVIFFSISVRLGLGIAGLGFAMFIFGGKTDSEKNGYKF